MSIDFYWLVEPINNNQWIVIDYRWLYWLQSMIDHRWLISPGLEKNMKTHVYFIATLKAATIFDTKTLTFVITVSNFSPWVINLLFRRVESGSDFKLLILALLLSHHSQLVSHKICSHFAISWGFVYLVKQSPSLPHKAFHDDKTNLQSS